MPTGLYCPREGAHIQHHLESQAIAVYILLRELVVTASSEMTEATLSLQQRSPGKQLLLSLS